MFKTKPTSITSRRFARTFGVVGLNLALMAGAVAAPDPSTKQSNKFIYVNDSGVVQQAKTPSSAKIHLSGGLAAATASYTDGVFDGDTEDIDDLSISPALRATFVLPYDTVGVLRHLSLTLGTANSVTTDVKQPTPDEIDAWNDSNWFVGLGAKVGNGWLVGLTYEYYTNPSASTTAQQVALAAAHTGWWSPLAELEIPTDGPGYLATVGISPSWKFNKRGPRPWTLTLPLTVGVGVDDYYGRHTGTTGYFSVGLTASTLLQFMSPDYGNWTLSAGFRAVVRDDELRQVGPAFASTDTVIPIGAVSISFVY